MSEADKPVLPTEDVATTVPAQHLSADAMLLLGEIAGSVRAIPDQLARLHNSQVRLELKVDQNIRDVFTRITQVDDALDKRMQTCEAKVGDMSTKHTYAAGFLAAIGVCAGFIGAHVKGWFGA